MAMFQFPGGSQGWFIDTYRRVHQVHIPTLIIWGKVDELDPVSSAYQADRLLKCEKRQEIIPGNGHLGYRDINKASVFDATVSWFNARL